MIIHYAALAGYRSALVCATRSYTSDIFHFILTSVVVWFAHRFPASGLDPRPGQRRKLLNFFYSLGSVCGIDFISVFHNATALVTYS